MGDMRGSGFDMPRCPGVKQFNTNTTPHLLPTAWAERPFQICKDAHAIFGSQVSLDINNQSRRSAKRTCHPEQHLHSYATITPAISFMQT